MIKALFWAMKQHPDTINAHEKLVLIGLAEMCDIEQMVFVSLIKLERFCCLDKDIVEECLKSLLNKGYIKQLDGEEFNLDVHTHFKLLVTV